MWAVVWQSQVAPSHKDVYARLAWVDGTGTVQFSSPKVVQGASQFPDVSAYPESSTFMITTEDEYVTGYLGIGCRTLDTSNRLGAIYDVRGAFDKNSWSPAVAGGKNGWMMVWEQERDPMVTYYDIKGRIFFNDIMKDGFESNDTSGWSSTVP